MASTHGLFVWSDLVTTDVEAAQAFYTAVVGWTLTEFEGADAHKLWTGAEPVGGAETLSDDEKAEGQGPHWVPYIASDDLDRTAARVEELGGRVVKPVTAIPGGHGAYAVFRDLQGALFGGHQGGGDHEPYAGPPRPGDFAWRELVATDPNKAFKFYNDLFGWDKGDVVDLGLGNHYTLINHKDRALAGAYPKPLTIPVPYWLTYIQVDNLLSAVNRIRAYGGYVLYGPAQSASGSFVATAIDPQGGLFALQQNAI